MPSSTVTRIRTPRAATPPAPPASRLAVHDNPADIIHDVTAVLEFATIAIRDTNEGDIAGRSLHGLFLINRMAGEALEHAYALMTGDSMTVERGAA